jgi:3-phytase
MACKDGGGYWIGTDQFKDRSLFHVFDRRTLAPVGELPAGSRPTPTACGWMRTVTNVSRAA